MTNLKIQSEFSGENTRVTGTVDHNGHTHTVELTGSASARGTHATVDGEVQWWCGEEDNQLENAVYEIFEHAHDEVAKLGVDTESHWTCEYVNGKVENAQQVEDED